MSLWFSRPVEAWNGVLFDRFRQFRHLLVGGLTPHSDRGSQYLAIRYTERLAEAGAIPSVGSRGDTYDNALAESFNGLYKTELIRHAGPWRGLDDVEYATLEYIHWFNHQRLHGELGMIPPSEFEDTLVQQPATLLLELQGSFGEFPRLLHIPLRPAQPAAGCRTRSRGRTPTQCRASSAR